MIISTFKSVHKAYVDLRLDMTWDEMVDVLTHHYDVENKEDVELYNLVEFKDITDPTVEFARKYHYIDGIKQSTYDLITNKVRRCKNNVVALWGIVLDVDDELSIEETVTKLEGIEYVLYTTFRHTQNKNKFRVIIPFSTPLLKEDIEGRQQSIIDTFPGVDNASFSESQSFYFHSGKNDSLSFRVRGSMVNPYDFEYKEKEVFVPHQIEHKEFDDEQFTKYKQAVIESLESCSGLHYAGTGDNNLGVLTLVSICKSIGLTYNEYENICVKIADPTSMLKDKTVRHNAWIGWDGDRIRKETRDKFISKYNGKKIRIETPVTEYTDLMKRLKEKYGKDY